MAIRMNQEAADRVRTRFHSTRDDVEGARGALAGLQGDLAAGAGEFATAISNASDNFYGSWRAVYEVYSDSAELIAGNTNALYVDLMKLDDDLTVPPI